MHVRYSRRADAGLRRARGSVRKTCRPELAPAHPFSVGLVRPAIRLDRELGTKSLARVASRPRPS
ncbi:MAG: hypothetical protein BGO98_06295 [Myxococcales bacterium 68-20]|nr:MAG: hypothetical protein BGO98_06295 [Myxococcales bacterium 68-20]